MYDDNDFYEYSEYSPEGYYDDDYDDEWYDDYYDPTYVQEPVPLLHRIKDWMIARWWQLRDRLGLPTPYDDIPF